MPPPTKEPPHQYQTLDDQINAVLLKNRRLFMCEDVNNNSTRDVIRQLWYLELMDPGKPILFIINSPGGSVDAGFAIWDQVKMVTSPVTTLVTGLAASMGSILSLCATEGRRFATPNSRFMIHQPSIHGVIQGQASDIEIQADEMVKTHKALVELYVKKTGKSEEAVERALDRDTWMTPDEAKAFGLIDRVVHSYKDIEG